MTEALWTADAARAATGGALEGGEGWSAGGVTIDSRALAPGDLFVALKDKRDGHEFAPAAFEAGAAAALVSRPVAGGPNLIVPDVLDGLRAMAAARRDECAARRVAVTGSVGKTGVKEALRAVFAFVGKAHASERSFNNHWGAPLTLARMPKDAERAVFELGMNHPGELTDLSALVRPHIAAVTKIAPAHMAFFDSLAAIAEAKAEIFAGLTPGGVAVIPAKGEQAALLAERAQAHAQRLVRFGAAPLADVRVLDYAATGEGGAGRFMVFGEPVDISIPVSGAHWAENIACVLACAALAGVRPKHAAMALAEFAPPAGRGGASAATVNGAEIVLIDDAYNANPASMAAALAALGARQPGKGGRRIAVLGEMLELGEGAEGYHAALAGDAEAAGVDLVIAAGDLMGALWKALPEQRRLARVSGADEALDALRGEVRSGDVVLVKGSNASGMGRLAAALKAGGG